MGELCCWLQDSHLRVFPTGGNRPRQMPPLEAARGERLSFQVVVECVREKLPVRIGVAAGTAEGLAVRIRRVGFVPLPHHNTETADAELDCRGRVPGLVPDPLFDEQEVLVGPGETVAFWVTIAVAPNCPAGSRALEITVSRDGANAIRRAATVTVRELVVRRREGLPVTHWFYADALLDWYRLQAFEPRFWRILRGYLDDLVGHGLDTLYVPALTPALDGVKRPTQLLRIGGGPGRWNFDWKDVKRWTDLARRAGIRWLEWPHLFTQWGARQAIRVYRGQGEAEQLLWKPETPATSPVYRAFLAALLPRLRAFLQREGLENLSLFHVSDEPAGEEALGRYRRARALLRELAPWMRTMDALSEPVYGREGITDVPVAGIASVRAFRAAGIPCWGYFCCGPRGPWLNRLLDTPLAKVRMSGWLFRRFALGGFLHWGANYWYRRQTRELIDPFAESSGEAWPDWAYGDPFVLYPGPDGPIDSMRWEIFAESLGDYALLEAQGIGPEDPLLADLRDFDRFPKDVGWLRTARHRLLAGEVRGVPR